MARIGDVVYDPSIGRYRSATNGRLIASATVRRIVDDALANASKRAGALADDLRAGRISLSRFRLEMRAMVKEVHLYSAYAARGGVGQMTPADYGRVGQQVRREYGYLESFVQQIADGVQPLDGRLGTRARLYAQAGRETYHRVERAVKEDLGFTRERNKLDRAAEHCANSPESCEAQTAKGWVEIGALIPIGQRICGRNCRCEIEYAKEAA